MLCPCWKTTSSVSELFRESLAKFGLVWRKMRNCGWLELARVSRFDLAARQWRMASSRNALADTQWHSSCHRYKTKKANRINCRLCARWHMDIDLNNCRFGVRLTAISNLIVSATVPICAQRRVCCAQVHSAMK